MASGNDAGRECKCSSGAWQDQGCECDLTTWFYLNDNNGGIMSLCSQDYVNYCHQQGVEVWGLVEQSGKPGCGRYQCVQSDIQQR